MHRVQAGKVLTFGRATYNRHLTPAAPAGCRPATAAGPPTANAVDRWSRSWFFSPSRGPGGTGKTWVIPATRRRRGTDVVHPGRQEVGAAPPMQNLRKHGHGGRGAATPCHSPASPYPPCKTSGCIPRPSTTGLCHGAARDRLDPGKNATFFRGLAGASDNSGLGRCGMQGPASPWGGGVQQRTDTTPMTPGPLRAISCRVFKKRRTRDFRNLPQSCAAWLVVWIAAAAAPCQALPGPSWQ